MPFLEDLLRIIQDFLESLFASSSPEYRKKSELKQLQANLKGMNPPLWRDGILLPAFPTAVHQLNAMLAYPREVFEATVASPDRRAAEHYQELLFESELPPDLAVMRDHLSFAARAQEIAESQASAERVIEEQGKRLAQYLKQVEGPAGKLAEDRLKAAMALSDLAHFEFNELFSYFDPAFSSHIGQSSTVENPSFRQVEVAELIPALLDLYYLLTDASATAQVALSLAALEALRKKSELTEDIRGRASRSIQAVGYLLDKRVSAGTLLSIIRIARNDPSFVPSHPVAQAPFRERYRERITDTFDSESRKLLQEKQSDETKNQLRAVFGDLPLLDLEGYNDSTSALVQEFTPFALEWVEPLRIIRTFTERFFVPRYSTVIRSVIVEGYFNNRAMQSAMSASYSYCEHLSERLSEFERLFEDGGSFNLKILRGYVTEMEKGMDFETPLRKMIDNMNGHAKALVQQAAAQYLELYNFAVIIMEDGKKPIPDVITNVRTLTGAVKNSASFQSLERETGVFRGFLEIMKKYAIVGTLSVSMHDAEPAESEA